MISDFGIVFSSGCGTRSSELVISSKFGIKKAHNATRTRTPKISLIDNNKTLKIMQLLLHSSPQSHAMALLLEGVFSFFINFQCFKLANIRFFEETTKQFTSFQHQFVTITDGIASKQSKSRDYIVYILLKKTLNPIQFLRIFQGNHQCFLNVFLFFQQEKVYF